MVHNTFKRFMIILPAIFFKLGIAFTLLIVVALAGVTNGFIGFMLLVVGLSSVLARLQDFRKPAVTVPYISPLAAPLHHHQVWDRSDTSTSEKNNVYGTVSNYPYLQYSGMTGYSPIKYSTNS